MGQIKKKPTEKHDLALSSHTADFVAAAVDIPLHRLPAHLQSFPQKWSFPKGDLYHYVPLLNRFDEILEEFVKEYGLQNGPQVLPFGLEVVKRGGKSGDTTEQEQLVAEGFAPDGDRQLVEAVVSFSDLLIQNCGNRSIYSSNEHINAILNTTSLSLLKCSLQLCLGLAQRYFSSKVRLSSPQQIAMMAKTCYNMDLEKMFAMSESIHVVKSVAQQKDSNSVVDGADINTLLKKRLSDGDRAALGDVDITYYDTVDSSDTAADPGTPTTPSSPTPLRRGQASNATSQATATSAGPGPRVMHVALADFRHSTPEEIIAANIAKLPTSKHYELLQQVRTARGLIGTQQDLEDLVSVRLYALANIAYVSGEHTFFARVGAPDSNLQKPLQMAVQIANLLQPPSDAEESVSQEVKMAAAAALEALSKTRSRADEIAAALQIAVNHGTLFYVLRQVIAGFEANDVSDEAHRWREIVFTLVASVAAPPSTYSRHADQMVAAGIVPLLVQALSIRNDAVQPHYKDLIHFFDVFIHNGVRESFNSLVNARGLEAIADLVADTVSSSLQDAVNGSGLSDAHRSQLTDYKIAFYSQQTLRKVLKFVQNLFNHTAGGRGRHLRNLIDSPQLLGGLKSITENATIFGSNCWIGAVNIVTSFIHSEPTSYNVIHEAGLSAAIINAVSSNSKPDDNPSYAGILPTVETMRDIPSAFGAICLNEAGMKLFKESDALQSFLSIFLSLDHIKVLEEDAEAPIVIGGAFDELVRHHPDLKAQVSEAVVNSMKATWSALQKRAAKNGVGTKLWIPGPNRTPLVAGGRLALQGVAFDGEHASEPASANTAVSEAEVEAEVLTRGQTSGKSASDVISVICKFLQGYFQNHSMLAQFCDGGGISYLLDLAMAPCNPWNFQELSTFDELTRVFGQVASVKPHLLLPILISRIRAALNFLRPFVDAPGDMSYFGSLTETKDGENLHEESTQNATSLAKSLVAVQVLLNLVAAIFQTQAMYSPRSHTQSYFLTLNLTDYYVELVDAMGRLHAKCIWEEISLQNSMPDEWKGQTKVRGTAFSNATVDEVMGQVRPPSPNARRTRKSSVTEAEQPATQTEETDLRARYPAQFKNTEVLRYLLSQVPAAITSFAYAVGKSMIAKRGFHDVYQRQNANTVAEQLAKSLLAELKSPSPAFAAGPLDRIRFEIVVLSTIARILVDNSGPRGGMELLALIVNHFYLDKGFLLLNEKLTEYASALKEEASETETAAGPMSKRSYTTAACGLILDLYTKLTSAKVMQDSPQASTLSIHNDEPWNSDSFESGQLLVELRDAVVSPILEIWSPDDTAALNLSSDSLRSIITVLRQIIESDGEARAFRKTNARPRSVPAKRKWKPQSVENIDTLMTQGAESALAVEALFRCNHNLSWAKEYCALRLSANGRRSERVPAPADAFDRSIEGKQNPFAAVPSTSQRRSSRLSQAAEQRTASNDTDTEMSDPDADDTATGSNLAERTGSQMVIEPDSRDLGELPSHGKVVPSQAMSDNFAQYSPPVTVDDLNEKRKQIRDNLVDRCLDVLNEHIDVTFDIADLITAATSGKGLESAELKESIGETFVLTLISLGGTETESKGASRLGAIAHLLALVLQDNDIFDNAKESIKENFNEIVGLLKVAPDADFDSATGYLSKILLVLERALVQDEQPHRISWSPPAADSPIDTAPSPIQLPPPYISLDEKETLFARLLDLLPRVGKREDFALSITRVLSILTRRRQIAKRLAEKQNLQRLFLMVKQLSGLSSESLQSAFMLIVRHMVEDEGTIRQIMRTEIRLAFEGSRVSRPINNATYVKQLYHLVLRDPELFVEITNEEVVLQRWMPGEMVHALALKKPVERSSSTDGEASASAATGGEDTTAPSKRQPLERTKTSDMKPPTVGNPDGVVQFILKELSNYRDVEDKEQTSSQSDTAPQTSTSDAPEMTDTEMVDIATPPPDAPAAIKARTPESSSERAPFKREDHPIFTYRCRLLQILVELLSSYNHSKVEFIQFSPRGDAPSTTPGKPRSGMLNYILSSLIPIGTIEHRDTHAHRKLVVTSNWASSVIVALCNKTQEHAPRDSLKLARGQFEEEPDVTYVRRFVLEQAFKAYNSVMLADESTALRYSRLLGLSDLFNRLLTNKPNGVSSALAMSIANVSAKEIGRIMYEKNFIAALTSSISEIDLNFPNAKRAVKYILRPLRVLTQAAVDLSLSSDIKAPGVTDDDDISSATSDSSDEERDRSRDATPDIYRNSTLGQFEHGADMDDSDSSSGDDEDNEEDDYYGDGYDDDQMDYEEDAPEHGDVVSDEDEDLDDMGPIEGLPGDVDVEVIVDDSEESGDSDEDDSDDMDEDDSDEDEEIGDDYGDGPDAEAIAEMHEQDEDVSQGGEDDDGAEWEDADDDDQFGADDEGSPHGGPLDNLSRLLAGDPESAGFMNPSMLDRALHGDFFEDEMAPDEEEDEELGPYDEEVVYEPEIEFEEDDEDDDDEADDEVDDPWLQAPPHVIRSARRMTDRLITSDGRRGALELEGMRVSGPSAARSDGTNPLLRRHTSRDAPMAGASTRRSLEEMLASQYRSMSSAPVGPDGIPTQFPTFMTDLFRAITSSAGGGHIGIAEEGEGGFSPFIVTSGPEGLIMPPGRGARGLSAFTSRGRGVQHPSQRSQALDPSQALSFEPLPTNSRWQEEAQLLFPATHIDEALRVTNSFLRLIAPAAIAAKRERDKAEAERKAAEEKSREEQRQKAEAERKEREEKERIEREAAEAAEAEAAAAAAAASNANETEQDESTHDETQMEGVEETATNPEASAESAAPAPRIMATVRGREVDITDLGIDPLFLQEIPEDMRDDVIMNQLQAQLDMRRASGATRPAQPTTSSSQAPDDFPQDFFSALPSEIQQEILQAEATERNRRDREARRAAARESNQPAQAEEMGNADFMAMLDGDLRQSVLMDADESILASLPDIFRAEAEALLGNSRGRVPRREARAGADGAVGRAAVEAPEPKQRRSVVQMLDRSGVATLLRLMFTLLHGSANASLFDILSDICRNGQNRAEVVNGLLAILSDCNGDDTALAKTYSQLSSRSRQGGAPKTPQTARKPAPFPTSLALDSGVSNLSVMQNCLSTLSSLAQTNPRVATYFLNEHEPFGNQKAKTPKKGKGKENRAARYPINALLSLLDRQTVVENSGLMDALAKLLICVTEPLKSLLRRAKEEEKNATADQPTQTSGADTSGEAAEASADVDMTAHETSAETADNAKPEESKKKSRDASPPEVPEENLGYVVNIIAARECSGRTFQNTLDIINYLSAIPGAREIFGKELVDRTQHLGLEVLTDLQALPDAIRNAQSSTDMQGKALAPFSTPGSHQNKLLRVLLTLDYIFDPKRAISTTNTDEATQKTKDNLVSRLYDNETFVKLWTILSDCLTAVRERGNMNGVATILQPLVEAFMVVCKNTVVKEQSLNTGQESFVTTPPPEGRLEGLFFTFTEDHRKILNDLVRNNPKLMSGTFDVLVKNSKVLEFDNKRSYFNKRLHARNQNERPTHATLQLNVRRNDVFLDSYKALYFKQPNEIKYGKLNIKFAGEEGVDAGGVTREWFGALSRQMFNPNYALFNPVAADRTTFHPNPLSGINDQHLNFFSFIGRIIGKALYEGRVLDCHFSRAVYKRILGKAVSLRDMETLDLEYYKSLVWILENDITDIAFETFSVDVDRFGEVETIDLIENGRNVPVTEQNKHEYVRLVVEQRLTKSVEEQLEHFLIGFRDIVPLELISIFNENELELLISGLPDIDVDDWKNNTEYHNYTATSPQVQWFWRAVRSFDKEEQAKLLQFVTGTSKVPLNGFKELEGMNGFSRFNIHRDFGDKDRLPSSHTCFNQLDLPEYESYEVLRKQMYTAMTVGNDHFGFA